jgi:phenylpropionate dioxygenase-like ring-hydroxylating dioxygenase large terminal subunit
MSVLTGAPWLLAHKSMLEVNKPRKISLQGQDYVLWKDLKGNISALPNSCPHMAAMLSEGWCEVHKDRSSSIVCPYHALEFDSQGCTVLPGTNKKTRSQLKPLELIIQGDFIWSYGKYEPKMPIPNILNELVATYDFVGYTADTSEEISLLSMLMNMCDYNHQPGAHNEPIKIKEVFLEKFIDQGHHSHAYFDNITAPKTFREKLKNLALLFVPNVLKTHLENFFPNIVILRTENVFGKVAQCQLFIPESETRCRIYVLLFAQPKVPIFKFLGKKNFLDLAKVVIDQDVDILRKIYPNTSPKIKLNNEVGMDWVKRNFANFPEIVQPNFSRGVSIERKSESVIEPALLKS